MSIEATAWALNATKPDGTPLDPTAKLALIGIASHADKFGDNAWPSMATLSGYVGRSVSQTRRVVHALADLGLVEVVTNGGGSGRTPADRRPNLYRLPAMSRDLAPMPPRDLASEPSDLAPMPPRDLAPMPPEPSLEPSLLEPPTSAPAKRTRARRPEDGYIDIFVEVFGQTTRSGMAFYATHAREIVAMPDATPDELRARSVRALQRYGPKTTPKAVAKNWPMLAAEFSAPPTRSKFDPPRRQTGDS